MSPISERFERSNPGTLTHHASLSVVAPNSFSLAPQPELNTALSPTLFRSSATKSGESLTISESEFESDSDSETKPRGDDSLRTARNLGRITTPVSISDSVNSSDLTDYYRFTLDTASIVDLSVVGVSSGMRAILIEDRDRDRVVDIGETIGSANTLFGGSIGNLTARLTAGTYFIQAVQETMFASPAGTNYSFTLSATPFDPPPDLVGNTLRTARNIGQITTPETFTDFVAGFNSNIDSVDYYRFTLDTASIVDLSVVGVSSGMRAILIEDRDRDRVVDIGETIGSANTLFGGSIGNLTARLTAGTYFIQAVQETMFASPAGTNYSFTLSATPFDPPPDLVGNTLRTARNIGQITTPETFTDFVAGFNSNIDPVDYYRFTLDTTSTLNLSVAGTTGGIGVSVIQDINGNRIVDAGEVIGSSGATLTAGTYFLQVSQGGMFGTPEGANYSLTVSATPFDPPPDLAGNTLRTARNIGQITTPETFTDSIDGFNSNIDTSDYYRFRLETTSNLNLSLVGVSDRVSVELIQDVNRNSIVDTNEVIRSVSPMFGSSTVTLTERLDPGTYFIRAYQDVFFGTVGGTNYKLTLAATPFDPLLDLDRNTEAQIVPLGGQISAI